VPVRQYYSGNGADIQVYENKRGDALAADFVDGLPEGDQVKDVRLMKEFAERGEIRNTQKFRLEQKPIYTLESFQIRILCFYLPGSSKRTIILTHGFVKKGDKLPKRELSKALQIHGEIAGKFNPIR
jgi:hypothetical protein